MKQFFTMISLTMVISANAQKESYLSIGIYNTQNAMPFGKFGGLFGEVLHPGIEFGYGKILSKKDNHEWFGELKLSYFMHRYVQHGIPLYANFGYRRILVKRLFSETSMGLGYLHSIPATGKYKLSDAGEYVNNKGIGRLQATVSLAIGLNYILYTENKKALTVFTLYQQRVQMPFVKSYVPLLPYNSFMTGVRAPIKKRSSSTK